MPARRRSASTRKGIQLTQELEDHLDRLRRCATCYAYEEKTETYIFGFFVDDQTRVAFGAFWASTLELYSAFHKLSMLNDLAIPKTTRERFRKEVAARLALRLPEPQDEEKVFRFERVNFFAQGDGEIVDYVSLSDGEHQLAQILGMFGMVSLPNALFLLDEPESHFSPQWRVKFMTRVLDMPTPDGTRRDVSGSSQQDCLLTTHAPFVPSDSPVTRCLSSARTLRQVLSLSAILTSKPTERCLTLLSRSALVCDHPFQKSRGRTFKI